MVGVFSASGAQRLFDRSGHTVEQVYAAARNHKPPAFALAKTVHFHSATSWPDTKSPNVVAKLKGSDLKLSAQYIESPFTGVLIPR